MKALIRDVLYGIIACGFKLRFRLLAGRLKENTVVYVVDIDNTLADTWPSLHRYHYRNENQRYSSLSVFIGMRSYILQRIADGGKVIFISARSYFNYRVTRKWLRACGMIAHHLVLVDSAQDKLTYLRELLVRDIRVVYIDDLSYDHEYGEMKLYGELIAAVKTLPLTYLGVQEIDLINAGYAPIHQDPKKNFADHQDYH